MFKRLITNNFELIVNLLKPKKIILFLLLGSLNVNAQNSAWISNSVSMVEEICWSPTGDKIASVGWNEYVSIWNSENGDHHANLLGHTQNTLMVITSVRWSHKGDRIASGGFREVVLWDADKETLLKKIPIGASWIFALRWSPDDDKLAYESNGAIYIMDSKSGEIIATFFLNTNNSGGVKASVCWLNDSLVMAGSQNGELKIFNLNSKTGICSEPLPTSGYGLYNIALSPNGKTVSIVSYQKVYLVDAETFKLIDSFKASQDYLWSSSWSPDGRYLATSGNWSQVRIYDMTTKEVAEVIPFPEDTVQTANTSLLWSPSGEKIAIGSQLKDATGRVSVWNVDEKIINVARPDITITTLSYSLSQNYPNPFNPETIIRYQLAVSSYVILKIYDVLGNEIATLVNEEQQAGKHSITFNATNNNQLTTNKLASGIYYYRLQAGQQTQTKRMIFLK